MTEMRNRAQWTRRQFGKAALAMGAAAAIPRWLEGEQTSGVAASVTGVNSLRAYAEARGLMYGTAVIPDLLDVDGVAAGATTDRYTQLIQEQASILVAENAMKWHALRPSPTSFDFAQADKLMRFAKLTGQSVRGHNLCWHEGNPGWLNSTATKENARQLLTEHIQTVAGHFRGQLHSWDVVNEAINPSDRLPDGLRKTPWLELIGPDYLELAFRTAAAADPTAKLTYNDYDIELDTWDQATKRDQVLALVRRFKASGVPIHAVGVQSHLKADAPLPGGGLVKFIRTLRKMGLEVYVTEMDVNTRAVEGGPNAQDKAVAKVFGHYPHRVLAEPNVPILLTWGITSKHSWLSHSEEPWAKRPDGARQRPLPFDDDLEPTPAFAALRSAIDRAPARKG
ncbi:MAG: endo-1,4-beta-xylanase [Terracidiphilus sp.]